MAQHATSEWELAKHAIVKGQVLVICTSVGSFGNTDAPTGLWLGELAEPYFILKDAGYDVTIASPHGGAVSVDPASMAADAKSPEAERMLTDDEAKLVLQHTVPLSDIRDAAFYDALLLPGGHGPMFDLAADTALADLLTKANDAGKLIAAVCHGPAGLLLAKGDDGRPLVAGRRVAAFTNSEEAAVGKDKMVPFLLEDRLRELGADLVREADWQECVVLDGNLITGQNPGSARGVGRALLEQLNERRQKLGERASGGVTLTAAEAGLVGSKAGGGGAASASKVAAAAADDDRSGVKDTRLTDAGACC